MADRPPFIPRKKDNTIGKKVSFLIVSFFPIVGKVHSAVVDIAAPKLIFSIATLFEKRGISSVIAVE